MPIRLAIVWLWKGLILRCVLLSFVLIFIYLDVSFLNLQVLLYQIAALHFVQLFLMVLYIYKLFACWALMNLTLYAPCVILQYVYKPTRYTKFL